MATPAIRSVSQQATGSSTLAVAWPSGTVAGDTVFIFVAGQNETTPTGWTMLWNKGNAFFWNDGGVFSKVMTSADIAAGSVTFGTSGIILATAVCFVGAVVYQGVETNYDNSTASPTVTTNTYVSRNDAVVLLFGSARATIAPTCDTGVLALNQTVAPFGATALYTLSGISAGLLAPQFSYTGYDPQGYWQAVLIVSGTSPAPPSDTAYFLVTSSGPFTVPADFDPANNFVGCVGGGGAGAACGNNSAGAGAGGGGGNYSGEDNYALIPGATYIATIGAGGTCSSGSGFSGTDGGDSALSDGVTTILSAKGGKGAVINTAVGTTPNPVSGSIGTKKFQGGRGGHALGGFQGGGGGGGAAGPEGGGGKGGHASADGSGGGGGGANGGGAGGDAPIARGGNNGYGLGFGKGSGDGTPAIMASVGGGGAGGESSTFETGGDGTNGLGGGSGGSGHIGADGFPAGNYGGASGGGGGAGGTPGNGAPGVIILAYRRRAGCRYFCN